MKIEISEVLRMIRGNEYLETDDRHTQAFCDGIKTAHNSLKIQLEHYFDNNSPTKTSTEDGNGM